MKMTESLKQAQVNMQPGVITPAGFLGADQRTLADIIAADEATMASLGLDWDDLVSRLREFLEAGLAGLGESVSFKTVWQVRADETRGKFASPWEDGLFRKLNVEVTRQGVGRMVFNELSIWMAERHHFLQGIGSPFRLDPYQMQALLFD